MTMELHQKVTTSQLKRRAFLYVRQSTPRQVLEHSERTARQYALRKRAVDGVLNKAKRGELALPLRIPGGRVAILATILLAIRDQVPVTTLKISLDRRHGPSCRT